MTPLRPIVVGLLCLFLFGTAATSSAADLPRSRLQQFLDSGQVSQQQNRTDAPRVETLDSPRSTLSLRKIMNGPADQCTVFLDYPFYGLYDWMTGYELYEKYMDLRYPQVSCDTSYPFQVTHICQTLALNAPGSLYVQAFVADLDPDISQPDCPYPGEFIEVSDEFPGYIPEAGVYILDVDFDPPVEVNGPWFSGMYYNCDMSIFDPALAIDTIPYLCLDYNDWGYGLYDLADNEYYPFPGSIDLFTIGYNGSGSGGPGPQPHIIVPQHQGMLSAGAPVWVAELVDTAEYMGCYFEYWSGADWVGFGADVDGSVTLRNGILPTTCFDGWQVPWDPQSLPEDYYSIKTSVIKLDSTYVADSIDTYYDMYPLKPDFSDRSDFEMICDAESLLVTVAEPNVLAVTFSFRELVSPAAKSLTLLDRTDYGDANGNILDGNHYYSGEFGEYYSAPTVFGSLIKYWADNGYSTLLADADSSLNVRQLVEILADSMRIRSNLGAEDDNVIYSLLNHIDSHGGQLQTSVATNPNWEWLAGRFFGDRAGIGFALSQPYGNWLAVDQIETDSSSADSVKAVIYDPAGALLRDSYLLIEGDSLSVRFSSGPGEYHIDLAVAVYPELDTSTYRFFASDNDGSDDYRSLVPVDSLVSGNYYLMRARAHQSGGGISSDYWIMRYYCAAGYLPGDSDYNGAVNISDAVYLIAYIFGAGPAPRPVWQAGDADCNGSLNISDAVYLLAYIFGAGAPPCSQ